MAIVFELINGLAIGIEHVSGEEEDEFKWLIAIHFLCFRTCFYKF